jgi:hypothetical protein
MPQVYSLGFIFLMSRTPSSREQTVPETSPLEVLVSAAGCTAAWRFAWTRS